MIDKNDNSGSRGNLQSESGGEGACLRRKTEIQYCTFSKSEYICRFRLFSLLPHCTISFIYNQNIGVFLHQFIGSLLVTWLFMKQ